MKNLMPEHFHQSYSAGTGSKAGGLFGFGLRFGSLTGFIKPARSPKPRPKPKILGSQRYIFSVNALKTPVLAALGTAMLLFTGCATISENTHAYIGSPQFAPTTPESVQVCAAEPKQPKERLGEIILSIDGNPSRQAIEHRLKVAAAKLGADGVFVVSDKTHIYPMVYWDYWGPVANEDWNRLIVAVAFKKR